MVNSKIFFNAIKIISITIVCLLKSQIIFSQVNDVDFYIDKVSNNYPGFKDKIKGLNFDSLVKAIVLQNEPDTFKALAISCKYFRDQHLQIVELKNYLIDDSLSAAKKATRYINSLRLKVPHYKYEGFWINNFNNCVVALKNISKNNQKLEAIVIRTTSNNLYFGECLATMIKIGNNKYETDYRSPHSGGRFIMDATFRNDSVFTIGPEGKWRKIKSYDEMINRNLSKISYLAKAQLINDSNYIISLPLSSDRNVQFIDSLVKADSSIISKTPNLILDIRGNVGGRSAAFEPLLKWIFTNPIARTTAKTYATQDRLQKFLADIEEEKKTTIYTPKDDSEVMNWIKVLKDNIGKFTPYQYDTFRSNKVMANPKRVAVIIDYACQSAAELLILAFKQSKKVTLFGEHSMGAVDYLDFYPIQTPSKKYMLYIATTKRVFNPGDELDGIGISPDISIPDNINNWVEYVVKYYEKY